MKFIVAELVVNGLPDVEHSCLRSMHDVTDVLGDGVVEPADDALVDDRPCEITALFDSWRGTDVGAEVEFAEEGIKEVTPLVVIGVGELKNDGDVRFDIHRLKNNHGRSCRGVVDGCVAVERRSGGG